jgi:hypothetical protein
MKRKDDMEMKRMRPFALSWCIDLYYITTSYSVPPNQEPKPLSLPSDLCKKRAVLAMYPNPTPSNNAAAENAPNQVFYAMVSEITKDREKESSRERATATTHTAGNCCDTVVADSAWAVGRD